MEVAVKKFLTADNCQLHAQTTEAASPLLRKKKQFGSVLNLGSEGLF
jgi:hypothetical protein